MNNIFQKRILELTHQNNLLKEEIEKLKKNLNEDSYGRRSNLSWEKRQELAAELAHEDHPDFPNRGYSSRAYQDRPIRDLESENTRWHAANVSPLIQKHGLGDHASKLDQHGVPHAEHMAEVGQHPNFGAYVRDLKAAHEAGFEASKKTNRSGKGSRWHVEAFGKIKPLLRRS
jgi:hypothetical protein